MRLVQTVSVGILLVISKGREQMESDIKPIYWEAESDMKPDSLGRCGIPGSLQHAQMKGLPPLAIPHGAGRIILQTPGGQPAW